MYGNKEAATGGGGTSGTQECYYPSGELQGDAGKLPDRGTETGVTDTYGADLGQNATNRMGSIRGACKSDSGDEL